MEYHIYSNQIRPFARYAACWKGISQFHKVTCYGLDSRMIFVTQGEISVLVEDELMTLRQGDLLLIPPMYAYLVKSEENAVLYFAKYDWFMTAESSEAALPILHRRPDREKIPVNVHFYDFPKLDNYVKIHLPEAEPFFKNMAEWYEVKNLYFRARMNAELALLSVRIFQSFLKKEQKNNIEDIIAYIHAHYAEPISNAKIAEEFHYHPNYVNDIFVRHTGKSLHRYLLSYRIETAVTMLHTTEMPIAEIAMETGWKNASQFSRAFRKFVGVSPRAFRGK